MPVPKLLKVYGRLAVVQLVPPSMENSKPAPVVLVVLPTVTELIVIVPSSSPSLHFLSVYVYVNVGVVTTFTATWSVSLHPLLSVTITVYVVLVDGVAVTVAVLVPESPVDGLHVYEAYGVVPPEVEAVSSTPLVPEQKDWSAPALTVGFGLTVTVMVLDTAQSSAAVTTMV